MSTPEQTLAAIVEYAAKLRMVGVTHVKLDGCEFVLAPAAEEVRPRPDDDEDYSDPLSDPDTFRGGIVPSFRRLSDD